MLSLQSLFIRSRRRSDASFIAAGYVIGGDGEWKKWGASVVPGLIVLDRDRGAPYTLRPMTTLFTRANRTRRRITAAWAYDRV
jgi:hypothetical protein